MPARRSATRAGCSTKPAPCRCFRPRRLLWVRNAGAQKSLADDVKALSAEPPQDAMILIEAGDLKKGAALRSVVEASAIGMALPCYGDEDRDIDAVIDDELGKAGMGIATGGAPARCGATSAAIGWPHAARSPSSRSMRTASAKSNWTTCSPMTGDVSGLSVDDAVDAMLDGKIDDFDHDFHPPIARGSQAYLVLAAAIRQMQALHLMRAGMTGRNAAAVVAAARPPVFFARRKLVERLLERWPAECTAARPGAPADRGAATRQRPDLAVGIARQALLGIAVEGAASLAMRRR